MGVFMEKISPIITTHGRDFKMLRRAIDSAINQTYPFIEILVVDDNGRGTPIQQAIEKNIHTYYEDQVTYLVNEKNEGAQYSRNRGILASQGDFLCFLDDDDIWLPKKNEYQIKQFNNSEVGLVFSTCASINLDEFQKNGTMEVNYLWPILNRTVTFQDLLYKNYVGTTSQVMVRRQVFNEIGLFDLGLTAAQDYELWIRISKYYKCIGIDKALSVYCFHSSPRISNNFRKIIAGHKMMIKKYNTNLSITSKCRQYYTLFLRVKNVSIDWKVIEIGIQFYLLLISALIFDFFNFKSKLFPEIVRKLNKILHTNEKVQEKCFCNDSYLKDKETILIQLSSYDF